MHLNDYLPTHPPTYLPTYSRIIMRAHKCILMLRCPHFHAMLRSTYTGISMTTYLPTYLPTYVQQHHHACTQVHPHASLSSLPRYAELGYEGGLGPSDWPGGHQPRGLESYLGLYLYGR